MQVYRLSVSAKLSLYYMYRVVSPLRHSCKVDDTGHLDLFIILRHVTWHTKKPSQVCPDRLYCSVKIANFLSQFSSYWTVFIILSSQLEEASEMSVKIGQNSVRKNLKTFALQNFGMLFGLTIMFFLALYGGDISVG